MSGRKVVRTAEALRLMADGFSLASGTYIRGRPMVWLQRQIGCGGDSFSVHVNSYRSMRDRKWIEPWPEDAKIHYRRYTRYRVTETGKLEAARLASLAARRSNPT